MNKTKKECVYNGCNNTNLTSDKTMFHFPSQETKKNEWVTRSNCDINLLSTLSKQFLCEDHFDPIYMTCNQRRKLLLSTAVPFVCEIAKDIVELEQADKEIVEAPKQKKAKIEFSYILEDEEEQEEEDYEVLDISESETNQEENGEELPKVIAIPFQADIIVKPPSPPSPLKVKPKIDQSLVTTFIFKGEEYIQMPKEIFDQHESTMKQSLKMDFQREQKLTENKLKILEKKMVGDRKEMENFVTSFKELLKKHELVVEQNKKYKSAIDNAKEALSLGLE